MKHTYELTMSRAFNRTTIETIPGGVLEVHRKQATDYRRQEDDGGNRDVHKHENLWEA